MLENESFGFSAELSPKFSYPISFLRSRTAEHTMSTFQVADIYYTLIIDNKYKRDEKRKTTWKNTEWKQLINKREKQMKNTRDEEKWRHD